MMAMTIRRLGLLLVVLSLVCSEAFSQYRRDSVGRPGLRQPVPNNMSLVIGQTQGVHEQIVDLLQQLRRMQDLQVTTTVPFHTLSDTFFERNGLDFDFDIAGGQNVFGIQGGPTGNAFDPTTGQIIPTSFGTIRFRQGSFGSTVPVFGNYDPATTLKTGFAVIKGRNAAYFNFESGQGSNRTYTMQAPVVTAFNGQPAFVSDTSQRPFVTSVIPVVGGRVNGGRPRMLVPSWSQNPLFTRIPNYGVNPYRRFAPYRSTPQYTSPIADILRRMKLEGRSLKITPSSSSRQVRAPRPKQNLYALAAGQSFAGRLRAAGYSSAGQPAPSIAEIRRLRDAERQKGQSEAMLHYQRGLELEAAGKPSVAITYYRLALESASGDLKEKAFERLQALTRPKYSPKSSP